MFVTVNAQGTSLCRYIKPFFSLIEAPHLLILTAFRIASGSIVNRNSFAVTVMLVCSESGILSLCLSQAIQREPLSYRENKVYISVQRADGDSIISKCRTTYALAFRQAAMPTMHHCFDACFD